MILAAPNLEIALFTSNWEQLRQFWSDIPGIVYETSRRVHPEIEQHRFGIAGSPLKINHRARSLPPASPSGYRELTIASTGTTAVRRLLYPDGNRIRLVPMGHDGIDQIAVRLCVSDLAAHRRFYRVAMRLPEQGDACFRAGRCWILLEADPRVQANSPVEGPGWRYVTLRVADLAFEHASVLAGGGSEGRPPMQLRPDASISMVRDPDGNWIELAQDSSLSAHVSNMTGKGRKDG